MISAEPYKIRLITTGTTNSDKHIVVTIGNTFDGVGQNELIEDYVGELADDAINPIVDYEKMRYSPVLDSGGTTTDVIDYKFYFYGTPVSIDFDSARRNYFNTINTTKIEYIVPGPPGAQPHNCQNANPAWCGRLIAYYAPPVGTSNHYAYYNSGNGILTHKITMTVDVTLDFRDPTPFYSEAEVVNIYFTTSSLKTWYGIDGTSLINNSCINEVITAGYPNKRISDLNNPLMPSINGDWWRNTFTITTTYDSSLATDPADIIQPGQQLQLKVATDSDKKEGVSWAPSTPACLANSADCNFNGVHSFHIHYIGTSSPAQPAYHTTYLTNNIPQIYSENNFKGYTQSFFRLDFYDSVFGESQNLLFTDIMTVSEGEQSDAEFSNMFGGQNYFLYWLKNDPIIEENGFRDVWMTARFFNSVTGQIHQFLNKGMDLPANDRPTIDQYQKILRYTKIRLFANHTYMIIQRYINPSVSYTPTTGMAAYTIIEDRDNIGVNDLRLCQISILP